MIRSIAGKFGSDTPEFSERMAELWYSSLEGCFFFTFAGMLHGVEPDGYMHT